MSTMGYVCYKCSKCGEVMSNLAEMSSLRLSQTPRHTDGFSEDGYQSAGYGLIKQCFRCNFAGFISDFEAVDCPYEPGEADLTGLMSSPNCLSLKALPARDIDVWLGENRTSVEQEYDIRFSAYCDSRAHDMYYIRLIEARANSCKRLVELAVEMNKPEIYLQTAEICRVSLLPVLSATMLDLLVSNYPNWNREFVSSLRSRISDGVIPHLYVNNGADGIKLL
jgi:hypothetical protein